MIVLQLIKVYNGKSFIYFKKNLILLKITLYLSQEKKAA